MKQQFKVILQIPEPCSQNWADMMPVACGRFCTHCQKTVTDISEMSDAALVHLFQNNPNTLCVRANTTQLNRVIALPPQKPTYFYRIAVALGLTLAIAKSMDSYARPNPPLIENNFLFGADDSLQTTKSDSLVVKGNVVNDRGAALSGLATIVKQGTQIITSGLTASDGSFSIKIQKDYDKTQVLTLSVVAAGYAQQHIVLTEDYVNTGKGLLIKMNSEVTIINIIPVMQMGSAVQSPIEDLILKYVTPKPKTKKHKIHNKK
jgi:hypothetical protein